MTLTAATAAANQLRIALLDNGVRAVSLELMEGAGGSGWGVAPFKRGLGHHIVSRPPGTPGLALVKRGRTDLAGPLCNGYGGYDLIARIITMSWANHPGLGGPWTVPGWGTVPLNNGRPYIFGWEFEGGIEPYTDDMHDFMARCGAGTLDWLGSLPGNPGPAPLECWGEHKTWAPGRKIDRLGYTTESGRARIAAVRGTTPTEDDDMNADQVRLLQGAANGISALIGVAERPLEVERRLNAKLDAMLQLLLADDGESIAVDAVVDRVTEGVTVSVKRELLSSVADIVRAELGADNAAQADAIVDRIVDRLAGT